MENMEKEVVIKQDGKNNSDLDKDFKKLFEEIEDLDVYL